MKSSFCIDLQRFMLIPTKFPLSHRDMDSYAKYSSYPVVFNLEKYYALTK